MRQALPVSVMDPVETKRRPLSAEVRPFYEQALAEGGLHGVERDITNAFLISHQCGHLEDLIPMHQQDTIVTEMALKFGRADIVVFHVDGSASVIEVKDGAKGYNHVVAGIGQAGLYATQLMMQRGALSKVRRCLLWSSTGDVHLDALIGFVCDFANVVPLPYPSVDKLLACERGALLWHEHNRALAS